MFCIYCGSQTDNADKICASCAVSRMPKIPSYSEQAMPYNPAPSAPVFPSENIGPAPTPSMSYYTPVQSTPTVSKEDARAAIVKESMGSIPALLSAIFLTLCAGLNVFSFLGNNVVALIVSLFSVNILFILAAAAAWISFGTAKKKDKLPVTAGLKMASAVSIVYTVFMGLGILIFLILGIIVTVSGNAAIKQLLREFGLNQYTSVVSILSSALGAIFFVAALALAIFIVFYAFVRMNLGRMSAILRKNSQKNLNIFAIVLLFIYGAFVVINTIDIFVSSASLFEMFHIPYTPSYVSTIAGLCGGIAAICGGVAQLMCRKKLAKIQ